MDKNNFYKHFLDGNVQITSIRDLRSKRIPKIISLIPSATEILYCLGLEAYVIGVTENCNYPEEAQSKEKIGFFGNPQLSKILSLEPDIVLADGALHKKLIKELQLNRIEVLMATPESINNIFDLMSKLGHICQAETTVQPVINSLRDRVDKLHQDSILRRPRVFRLMSLDPLITPGPNSFQYDALRLAGAQLMDFPTEDTYAMIYWNQIEEFDPEVILFCGIEKGQRLPLRCKGCIAKNPICYRTADDIFAMAWRGITAVRKKNCYPISCDTICRPGPRMIDGMEKLHNLFKRIG